jgi:sensor c-di-GMP phosphodiesterase-like protein
VIGRKLRKFVTIFAGAVAAVAPAIVIHRGVEAYLERQTTDDVRLAAQRAIARAEWRIGQAIDALGTIAKSPLRTCANIDFEAMRRVVMSTTPLKEIAVVDAAGRDLCPEAGAPTVTALHSREMRTADDRVFIAVVRTLDAGDRALRIAWRRSGDALNLIAFVPADVFLPDASTRKVASEPVVRVMLSEGTLLAAPSDRHEGAAEGGDSIRAQNASTRYPLIATASVSRAAVFAEHADLRTVGALGGGALALLTLAFALLVPWRARSNPIAEMERALEANEFVPYYQPIVDLRTGSIVGAEVLMRWRKGVGTIIPPALFIPLAESSGLIVAMTRALMIAARDEFAQVLGPRSGVKLGFNLTARHFDNEEIVETVREVFAASPIRLSQIVLEVTERQPLEDLGVARRVIAALQELGCKVAIDDVGTGHGGLSYMLKLAVDYIKIDKMFIDAIGTDRYSTTIIEMLVVLARDMRMEIFAEGVETFEQVAYLRERGIVLAQGYAFAPPLPGPMFRQLLEAAHPLGSGDSRAAIPAARDQVAAA